MTRPAGTPRKKPERRRATESRQTRNHGDIALLNLSPTAARNKAAVPPVVNAWPTPPESITRTTQSSSDPARSFYLGSTSYASVFAQEQSHPTAFHEQPPASTRASPAAIPAALAGTPQCRMGIGNLVISKFTSFSFIERCIVMYFKQFRATALIGPLIISALPQLREDLQHIASMGDSPYLFYAEITKNSCRPLKVPPDMLPSEFHTLFTGPNLRWETLGLVLTMAASCAQFNSPDDSLFLLENGDRVDKDDFIEDMIHTTNDCISLCQVHGAVNDIMVWLLYSNMLVQSNFYGDNCMCRYHRVK